MKRKACFVVLVFFLLLHVLAAEEGTESSYGKMIKYGDKVDQSIELPLSFSLKDMQRYEFGFTLDNAVSIDENSNTTPLTTLPLQRDEEREAENSGDMIIVSANFNVYWKIVSGYHLKVKLSSTGAFSAEGAEKTINYRIENRSSETQILPNNGDYTTAVEIGDFSPDYDSNPQKFYDSELVYLEIYTVDDITNDLFNGNVSSYSTTLSLTVEVIN